MSGEESNLLGASVMFLLGLISVSVGVGIIFGHEFGYLLFGIVAMGLACSAVYDKVKKDENSKTH